MMGPRPACWLFRQAVHTPYMTICPPALQQSVLRLQSDVTSKECCIKRLQHPLSVALLTTSYPLAVRQSRSPLSPQSPTESPTCPSEPRSLRESHSLFPVESLMGFSLGENGCDMNSHKVSASSHTCFREWCFESQSPPPCRERACSRNFAA